MWSPSRHLRGLIPVARKVDAEPKRKVGRPKGSKASEKQREASKANARKTNAARKEKGIARRAAEADEKPRWKKLEDGDISVGDLTMDELINGYCANNDGSNEGRRHQLSTRIIQRMETERRRRIRRGIDKLAQPALDALEDILNDDDARAQQFAASRMVLEYQVGKVPDIVHVGAETEWDRMGTTAYVTIDRSRAGLEEDDDIVDAELVEE